MDAKQRKYLESLKGLLRLGAEIHQDIFPDYDTKVALLSKPGLARSEDENIGLNLWFQEGEEEYQEWLEKLKIYFAELSPNDSLLQQYKFFKITREDYVPIAWKRQLDLLAAIIDELESVINKISITIESYDKEKDVLCIGNKEIKFKGDQAQYMRALFSNSEAFNNGLYADEIYEEFIDISASIGEKEINKLYHMRRNINIRLVKTTKFDENFILGIKDPLKQHHQINPDFVSK